MTNRLWETAIERVGVLTAPLAFDELPDAELLRRFVVAREECAFAAIVRRHGSLVWAVCRSLMPSEADAEDAYQATFLVLVRSATKVRKAERARRLATHGRGSRMSKRLAVALTTQTTRASGSNYRREPTRRRRGVGSLAGDRS